jgi:hypothetical protein
MMRAAKDRWSTVNQEFVSLRPNLTETKHNFAPIIRLTSGKTDH